MGEIKTPGVVPTPPPPPPPKPAPLTGWTAEKGKEVFRDGGGNVRGEVILPDTSSNFFRVNHTDGEQRRMAHTLEAAKERVERHVAGM